MLQESFWLDSPATSTRQASVIKRRPFINNVWFTGLIVAAILAIGIVLASRTSAVARSPGQFDSNLCSASKTIDSIVSDTNLYAPGQQLVYRLLDLSDGAIDMVFEALHDHPWIKATSTLHQGFGMLTNDATATRLRVSFRSPESQQPLWLPTFAMSFVHMVDTNLQSHKNIKVVGNWTDAILAQDTTILVHQETSDDSISFNAGKTSNQQTPSNPSTFTVDQFNSAVTVRFVNLESFEIHIDVGVHEMHGFLFSTTALLCAELPVEKPPVKFVTNPHIFDLSKEDLENTYIVRATTQALFQQWYVAEGDYVKTGDDIFQVTTINGLQDIQSNVSGRVVHLQGVLPGDFLEAGVPLMLIDVTSGINWFWIAGIIGAAITIIAVIICICKCKKSDPAPPDDPDPEKPSAISATILEFETPSGWKQISEWKHQPLGLGFYEEMIPLKVAYVGRDASHMGVRQGDSLVAIGDSESGMVKIDGKAFESVWRELKMRANRLPFAPRLVLRFERQSAHGYRDFEWRTKPLGLVFSDSMPMTVTEVHEEAQHMGIRVGDVLKGYGRESHMLKEIEGSSADVYKTLNAWIADFPVAPGLVMTFELPDESLKDFFWRARPLGIEIGTSLPIMVEKVTSQRTKDLGIEVGFKLKSFGDDWRRLEVVDGQDATTIIADLERFINKLPTADGA